MKRLALTCLICLGSCQTKELHIAPHDTNAAPYASAGTGGSFPLNTSVSLDSSGSLDPDGQIVAHAWRITQRPTGSISAVADPSAAVTTLVLDAPGDYVVELKVTDDDGASASSQVSFHASAPQLVSVDAGPDQAVAWQDVVQLAGAFEADPDAVVTLQWTIIAAPMGSTATLTSESTLTPAFQADREGTYIVRLTASTPYQVVTDDVAVMATVARQLLEYPLVDAEYSTPLDRFVIVSDAPPELRLHDVAANSETVVSLPYAPVAVSLAPDGLHAAVAHDMAVSIVDLQTLAVTGTFPVPDPLYDVVFGGDDRVHLFHRAYNSQPLRTLDLATGIVADATGRYVYGFTDARLHPNTLTAYGTTNHVTPSDISRYDVSSTPVRVVGDSPYHGEYAMGGPLWFTSDGGSIITASGNIFYSSNDPMFDMTYRGTLGLGTYNWVAHAPAIGKLAALRTEYDAWYQPYQFFLRTYEDQQFTLLRNIMLPDTPYESVVYGSAGRFVAFSADATKIYVIARAGDPPGVVHALYTFDP